MVIATIPRIQLVTESTKGPPAVWRFQLTLRDDEYCLEISDVENTACEEQLGLLALVRGLEAIERHAEIDLITSSRYVQQGISFGMDEWRENDWRWESFGRLVPIKHLELWRRVDRALQYHRLTSVELINTITSGATIAVGDACLAQDMRAAGRMTSSASIRVHRLAISPAVVSSGGIGIVAPNPQMMTVSGGWHRGQENPSRAGRIWI